LSLAVAEAVEMVLVAAVLVDIERHQDLPFHQALQSQ
jgi:hypothetical protein